MIAADSKQEPRRAALLRMRRVALALLPWLLLVLMLALGSVWQWWGRAHQLWPADDRRALRWIIVVFAITLAATFTPLIKNYGVEYYAYLRSLTMDGDLQFASEYSAPVFPRVPDLQKLPPTDTGHIPNLASVGPALSFYLDRDTLPVWALPGWLRNGYFVTQVGAALSPAGTGAFVALVAVMVLATWVVVACFRRLDRRRSEITSRSSPVRSASLFGHKG